MLLELPIRTQRLELRDFQLTDFDAVHEYRSDPDVTRFMFFEPDTTADTEWYLDSILETQRAEPRQVWELAVVDTADSRLVGGCDLTLENSREADLGYILARRAWGKGYGTEIARALVERGFSDLGLDRIFATCDRENHASRRVLEKAGLLFESTLIHHKFTKSRWWDSELYALTRKDWSAAARHGIP
ncbi:MAG: GNAT family protein [Candidatus Binatia bacterium]|nr:GNAT family protein [Candidatus Binatia bacterium]MDG1959136.1 GNAT family protein [Candidatus Binatia bacterium]MDG2008242.1 GNAT family protein [Candidatus Binatia bacterium]